MHKCNNNIQLMFKYAHTAVTISKVHSIGQKTTGWCARRK